MRKTLIVGPAYPDMVVRVDQPLLDRGVLDGSVEGTLGAESDRWQIHDRTGRSLKIVKPPGTSPQKIPHHEITLPEELSREGGRLKAEVSCLFSSLDLGGMGAGYAKSFGGQLISAIGVHHGIPDPMGTYVTRAVSAQGIAALPLWVEGTATDWTLLITSGPHGDKLAIGFRGCHSAVTTITPSRFTCTFDLVVAAGFSNRVVQEALSIPAKLRLLAPARRNINERDLPLAKLAGRFDMLTCNRGEWVEMENRQQVLTSTPIVAVTDGENGCVIFFLSDSGQRNEMRVPAFPRDHPPADTNRAGESFTTTLVETLLDRGWKPGPISDSLARYACERGQAAAALTLDRLDFGFPDPDEIDRVMRAGRVTGVESSRAS